MIVGVVSALGEQVVLLLFKTGLCPRLTHDILLRCLAASQAIVSDGALDDEAIVAFAYLAKVSVVVLQLFCVLELLGAEKALPNLLSIKILYHFFELLC